jgi:hypothetical protein
VRIAGLVLLLLLLAWETCSTLERCVIRARECALKEIDITTQFAQCDTSWDMPLDERGIIARNGRESNMFWWNRLPCVIERFSNKRR